MKSTVFCLVFLPMFLDVVYSDETTREISSVLELFPEFKQMTDKITKLEKGWGLPYRTHLKNYKMKTETFESRVVSSGLECWIACAEINGCTSVSFQSEGGKCEMSRAKLISYESLEKGVGWDVFTKQTLVVSLHDRGYSLDFAGAKAYCVSLELSIATLEDLKAAYNEGYQRCSCGWAANGVAYLVMQEAMDGCQSSVGVIECTWQSTWNVYCKPLKTD